jgi:hypothetical protein
MGSIYLLRIGHLRLNTKDIIVEMFNHLPWTIRKLSNNVEKFRIATKNFLLKESFYSINEYLEWPNKSPL